MEHEVGKERGIVKEKAKGRKEDLESQITCCEILPGPHLVLSSPLDIRK